MKYIFVAGAPGSKWSSVVKNIYFSPNIDRSDYSDARTYWHDASGKLDLMHLGAYYDPGMEFGTFFDNIEYYNKKQCEEEFDRPFDGKGTRIIKSHEFCNKIDFLKEYWPECPIVLVHRDNDSCLGWWVKCGHFNITYPKYDQHYVNLREMATHIEIQNSNLLNAWEKYDGFLVRDNIELADTLQIHIPPEPYRQNYHVSDVSVKVI